MSLISLKVCVPIENVISLEYLVQCSVLRPTYLRKTELVLIRWKCQQTDVFSTMKRNAISCKTQMSLGYSQVPEKSEGRKAITVWRMQDSGVHVCTWNNENEYNAGNINVSDITLDSTQHLRGYVAVTWKMTELHRRFANTLSMPELSTSCLLDFSKRVRKYGGKLETAKDMYSEDTIRSYINGTYNIFNPGITMYVDRRKGLTGPAINYVAHEWNVNEIRKQGYLHVVTQESLERRRWFTPKSF